MCGNQAITSALALTWDAASIFGSAGKSSQIRYSN